MKRKIYVLTGQLIHLFALGVAATFVVNFFTIVLKIKTLDHALGVVGVAMIVLSVLLGIVRIFTKSDNKFDATLIILGGSAILGTMLANEYY